MDDSEGSGIIGALLVLALAMGVVAFAFSGSEEAQDLGEQGEAERARAHYDGWGRMRRGSGAIGGGGVRTPELPEAGETADPQERAFSRSYSMTPDAGTLPPFAPSLHLGRVLRTDGDSPVAAGERCELRVLPVESSDFNCLLRVMCGETVIYPDEGQAAGYAPCELDDGLVVRALDDGITSEDGDPIVDVDLAGRQVLVADDGPMGRRFSASIELRAI